MTTHLAVRSCYSLLEGTLTIDEIVKYAKQYEFNSVGICDRNVMFGVGPFYRACLKNNIKPIIGMEVDYQFEGVVASFILIAKNNNGYRNLLACSTYLNSVNNYLDLNNLMVFSNDCFVIIPGENGVLEESLLKDDETSIFDTLKFYQTKLDNLYIGLTSADKNLWQIKNQMLKSACIALKIKTFALSRINYGKPTDDYLLRALKAIKNTTNIDDESLTIEKGLYFRSSDEMLALYELDDLIASDEIANSCHVDIYERKSTLPIFKNTLGASSKDYLYQLCKAGLTKRFVKEKVPIDYTNRLAYELKVIFDMNYEDYFLIVWDFIKYARKQGIYVGPGRGSAAGSIVAWSLGITHVDPLKYDLLFERFLNPERISLPDIDVDFPDDRRDEVIKYVASLYGEQHIAHIATFGTFGAKQAIRDIGRIMKLTTRELDMIAKTIPNSPKVTLTNTYQNGTKFKQIIDSDERYTTLFNLAKRIEGLPRHISTHAAGIVMSRLPLSEVVALIKVEPDMLSTQATMEYLEELGLIKIDFLALRNLTIIAKTLTYIKPKIDIFKIPYDDQKTYDLISKGDTVGIFQLESSGMKNLIKKMRPDKFADIAVCIALYRPGPMENIAAYLTNRQKSTDVTYLHPDMIPILAETYGVIIYQEQIMKIAQVMAGFSLSRADILRKAMSKKNATELIKLKENFINGCIKNNYSKLIAEQLYQWILKFANYGFNKSHSVAYGMICYQMAYLKANYPQYFLLCLLDSVVGSEVKTAEYINECYKCLVKIAPISINYSSDHYQNDNNEIRIPLLCIKGVGLGAVSEIVKERIEKGLFKDYYEFIARINLRKISRSVIESLIDAGALDEFNLSRKTMLLSLDDALEYANLVMIDNADQSYIDFGLVYKPQPIVIKDNQMEKLQKEKKVLGFYLSEHPMIALKKKNKYQGMNIAELEISTSRIMILVHILKIKNYQAKTGDMAFVTVDDETGSLDLVVLPNQYKKLKESLEIDKFIFVEGRVDKKTSFVVDNIIECTE